MTIGYCCTFQFSSALQTKRDITHIVCWSFHRRSFQSIHKTTQRAQTSAKAHPESGC